jgi:uncharacterized protein (TIGR03083 family)
MLDVTPMLRPERETFLALLAGLTAEQWELPTECPAYSIKGLATHVLGDDLSLLSRQRDRAVNGLLLVAEDLPGADFRTLLDTFNDRWVATAAFFGTDVLIELLRDSGDRTAEFYEQVDLEAPCEPVGFFGSTSEPSPYWQAIAREYVERWVHHSQIRRALGRSALADERFVETGVQVMATAARVEATNVDGRWRIGAVDIGASAQAAELLTRAYRADEVRERLSGPADAVERMAAACGR